MILIAGERWQASTDDLDLSSLACERCTYYFDFIKNNFKLILKINNDIQTNNFAEIDRLGELLHKLFGDPDDRKRRSNTIL